MAGNNEENNANGWVRQFLLDELEFNLERQAALQLELDEEHGNIWPFNGAAPEPQVDEGFNDEEEFDDGLFDEVHYGEHPVLPGQDPRGPPYMLLQLFDGAAPEPQQHQQFPVQERPGIFEFLAHLIAMGLQQEPVPAPQPKVYEFVLQPQIDVKEDWVCSICLDTEEENGDIKVLHPAECHCFHNTCLQRWLGQTPTCPDCRAARTPMFARPKPQ